MKKSTINILEDSKFQNGFKLKGLSSIIDGHQPIKEYRFSTQEPSWYLCQWNSKYNLINNDFVRQDSQLEIMDISKKLTINQHGCLIFQLNAGKEYNAPRKVDEGWPHLLIEQDITQNNRIKDLCEVRLKGEFALKSLKNHMGDLIEEHHTTQFVWVVVLKNQNKHSLDYQRFIWVVFSILDTRFEYPPLFCQQDKALPNGEFIYGFAGKDYLSKPLVNGGKTQIDFDLYPHIGKILTCAKSAGFLLETNIDDLEICSTNMGFEITGTFDAEISACDFGIYVLNKEDRHEA